MIITPGSASVAKVNSNGIIEVVLKGNIIQPPVFITPYAVDEIDRLANVPDEEIQIKNLWHLACSLVYHDVASTIKEKSSDKTNKKDKGKSKHASNTEMDTAGKDMDKVDRYILYYTLMQKIWRTFPLREDGNFILQYFYRDGNDNGAWPPEVENQWETILSECRKKLKAWIQTDVCPMTAEQKTQFQFEKQVWIYAGYIIDQTVDKAEKMANTHLNKHWPKTFASGQSPAATLQVIRHHYWDTVVVSKKADTACRQFVSRKKAQGVVYTDEELVTLESSYRNKDEYKFKLNWYPPQWLVWYCYGPPAALNAPEFGRRQMDHLVQVMSVPQGLTLEEEVLELGKLNKYPRKAAQSKKNKNKGDENSDDENRGVRIIKHIREDVRPLLTKADHLETAIQGKHVQMQLAMTMGMPEEEVNSIRREYFQMLQTKVEMAMNAFATSDA